MEQELEL